MKHTCLVCIALLAVICAGCSPTAPNVPAHPGANPNDTGERRYSDHYGPPVKLADLADKSITESSGLVASRRNPGIFWTHNDSGDGPFLYSLDRTGKNTGVWAVSGATNVDWEDIAAGPGPEAEVSYLYVGDIGDNSLVRKEIVVYRVAEPAIAPVDAEATHANPRATDAAFPIRLRYPDGKHNAEALMIHPRTGNLYVVTKERNHPAGVYRFARANVFDRSEVQTLEKIAEVKMPSVVEGMVTGGDISPEGDRLILCDYFAAYELTRPGAAGTDFDTIWKATPLIVDLGTRQQGEAICYSLDGRSILATSENLPTPLIEIKQKIE